MVKIPLKGIWISLAVISVFMGCNDKIEPGTTQTGQRVSIKTEVAMAVITNQPFVYEALGTITAQTASTLSGQIMGTVKAVNVREGDLVRQGDILVVLDKRQVDAGLRQSEASLSEAMKAASAAVSARSSARAGADLAQATYKRYQTLFQQDSATRQEFEEVEARYLQAQASLSQAEAMVAAAQSRIQQARAAVSGAGVSQKDATILAPYDGIVTGKMITVGDLAAPGTPLLTIEKKGGFQADLVLPENHIQAVRIGQSLDVSIPSQEGSPVLTGTVRTIVPMADLRSRSFTVKINLPENGLLRSGMFARVSIPVGEGGMLLIPESALVVQGQLTGYFLVDDNACARFRLMRTGRRFENQIEIISGMKEGTRYVVSPPEGLKDGMTIEDAS
ncbi:MAG: efflux RND transporter periplasmic adaptor subunit [Proteobacteria bacterium]|nr:efflux RND transporter periplasmic adaptor subunit [Pseudomonadota bacterium]MBU1583966.1 efflux RND transporter periplasmic adaptor subunit [Pseudomonadota bacterium]MBU2455351.1 efflux RND transporter periplasmic adaptor subunit [Pseudomonadota bacterium]MBU2627274.1 efflux RND transporter periplasmic adaptor subunit [Pseudomonadota bacterium]